MGTYGNNPPQEGDVLLYHASTDDGDCNVVGGITEMTQNFDTMAYLALFGGNDDDPSGDDKSKQWWGNFSEPDETRHYRSELQYILIGMPSSSANLLIAEQAALRDLQGAFIDTGIAGEVTVEASIPTRNKLKLACVVIAEGQRHEFTFTENWESVTQ